MPILILILLLFIPIGAILVLATPVLLRGGPYVATSRPGVAKAIKLAAPKAGEIFLDLGSGDGRLLLAAAAHGARVIGYETNPWLGWQSRRLLRRAGYAKTSRVIWGNLWHADLATTDVICIFILPNLLIDLEKKLNREVKKGTRIVTIGWPLPTWPVVKKIDTVFLYQKT